MLGPEGEEKAQKTYNYNFDGSQIKSTTTFTYAATDELASSLTVKGQDGTIKTSETFYAGPEGEEKAQKNTTITLTDPRLNQPRHSHYAATDELASSLTVKGQDGTIKTSETFYAGPEVKRKHRRHTTTTLTDPR